MSTYRLLIEYISTVRLVMQFKIFTDEYMKHLTRSPTVAIVLT
jgi:hypothetical protein